MCVLLPIILYVLSCITMVTHFPNIAEPGINICLMFVCTMLLCFDMCSKYDHTLYWAHMFVFWSFAAAFVSACTFNIHNIEIACWTFSAGAWQAIRVLILL